MNSKRSMPWLRFGAEFVVIVVGVLTALLLESWWAYAGDRDAEAKYLEQMRSDLERNGQLLAEAIALEQQHLAVVERIEAAMYEVEAPDPDSLTVWLGGRRSNDWWYADPRLVDGTMTALVATGDLALLRDTRLRSGILSYLGQLSADSEEFRRFVQLGLDAESTIAAQGEEGVPPGTPPGPDREVQRLLRVREDPRGRAAVGDLRVAYFNRVWYLEQMLAATDSLMANMGHP